MGIGRNKLPVEMDLYFNFVSCFKITENTVSWEKPLQSLILKPCESIDDSVMVQYSIVVF